MVLNDPDFLFLQDFIYRKAAIVLPPEKRYLAEVRLEPLLARHNFKSLGHLVSALRTGEPAALPEEVIDAFTTNETSFFRDNHPFEYLAEKLIPRLMAARRYQKKLRLWSAASSTGQEAYSLAILLLSRFPELSRWEVTILGTDISPTCLETARLGLYRRLDVQRGLTPEQIQRFFTPDGLRFQIRPELRAITQFQRLNLVYDNYPAGPFDIIFLRNVLIYFDRATQHTVLQKMHSRLAEDGALFLGGAEAALPMPPGLYNPHLEQRTVWHSPAARKDRV